MIVLFRVSVSCLVLALFSLAACSAPASLPGQGQPAVSAASTSAPQSADPEEAIRQLIRQEGEGVVAQDLDGLMALWLSEGSVADAKHTPDDPNDDARWRGRDAIRERYQVLVFPGAPSVAGAVDVQITLDGDKAVALSTTRIGDEVSPGGDRWTFVKRDGRWYIESLTYNLEP